jgi:hypothetical protein
MLNTWATRGMARRYQGADGTWKRVETVNVNRLDDLMRCSCSAR